MLDDDNSTEETTGSTPVTRTRRRAAGRPAGPPAAPSIDIFAAPAPPSEAATKPAGKKAAPKAKSRAASTTSAEPAPSEPSDVATTPEDTTAKKTAKKATRSRAKKAVEPATDTTPADAVPDQQESTGDAPATKAGGRGSGAKKATPVSTVAPAFQAPETVVVPSRQRGGASDDGRGDDTADDRPTDDRADDRADDGDRDSSGESGSGGAKRRRRSRGGRRRNKSDDAGSGEGSSQDEESSRDDAGDDTGDGEGGGTRRRRRRARSGEGATRSADDPDDTVVKVREGRSAADEIAGVSGSTRLEAKKQRRREGREAGRRRAPIVSEAEFLARRESVERQMIVRQSPAGSGGTDDSPYTQIAVLEDSVLVEHYVARESQISIIGNVYLGKVQNVLPSMEAAFVDIGAGRNAVIYAGEVDWSGVQNGKARKIEEALSPGQTVLVQVTKDPIGQKGARLTSQISLPGRFLVYVPGGQTSGISRKLPDTERTRLKALLKEVLPEDAGVIVRTAAEGATEEQLTRDVTALTARWEDIEGKVEQATAGQATSGPGKAPQLLYAEPDLVIKVVRDLFNEDFASLVVEGPDAWDNISGYIRHVAPDLAERLQEWRPDEHDGQSSFEHFRLDEQIHKALERKVWLPSGGSLVIDRTEAMTVVDVNTGKFTGSGGNLEETVTKNNLEAAEEMVRQLRLRDIGGIIVIDFIDMVLESNRDLVLRRLVECLGRDRTRHQVAEVTSLGLVQMTRKRIGTGLLESFSSECDHCKGRGVVIAAEPVEPAKDDGPRRGGGRRRGGRGGNDTDGASKGGGSNGGGSNGGGSNGGGRPPKKADPGREPEPAEPAAETVESTAPAAPVVPEKPATPAANDKPAGARTGRRRATRPAQKADEQPGTGPVLTETPEDP